MKKEHSEEYNPLAHKYIIQNIAREWNMQMFHGVTVDIHVLFLDKIIIKDKVSGYTEFTGQGMCESKKKASCASCDKGRNNYEVRAKNSQMRAFIRPRRSFIQKRRR